MTVRRIFVEKRQGFYDVAAQQLCADLTETFRLLDLKAVRIINRYDIEGISDEEYEQVKNIVFAEPPVDVIYEEELPPFSKARVFAIEYLPGQYDQRADSAAQCVQLITQKEQPLIRAARVIVLVGMIDDETFVKIKDYCINKVESREASLKKPASLKMVTEDPADVEVLDAFNAMDEGALKAFHAAKGFAMRFDDLQFCQKYFRDEEHRAPTITELRVIDTYWSDHCRHTTFTTAIDLVDIEEGYFSPAISKAYEKYIADRQTVYGDKIRDVTLMDIAVMGMKALRKEGLLTDLDESEEINACSVVVKADVSGKPEDWLVMFKNETHNHPTEIEPFGGAATCLGGAIRDPLSGRSYVYQAMRVTGAADPRRPLEDTLPGKLPQKKITLGAAAGYSSYGNQIGLATGQVREVYHDGYLAKRIGNRCGNCAVCKDNHAALCKISGTDKRLFYRGCGREHTVFVPKGSCRYSCCGSCRGWFYGIRMAVWNVVLRSCRFCVDAGNVFLTAPRYTGCCCYYRLFAAVCGKISGNGSFGCGCDVDSGYFRLVCVVDSRRVSDSTASSRGL